MTFFGYANMLIFMIIVLAGFYYEWAIGLLEWLPKKLNTDDVT
jgi:NADH:ubiquinone oxidoreductase subunit 3 (subunit A)